MCVNHPVPLEMSINKIFFFYYSLIWTWNGRKWCNELSSMLHSILLCITSMTLCEKTKTSVSLICPLCLVARYGLARVNPDCTLCFYSRLAAKEELAQVNPGCYFNWDWELVCGQLIHFPFLGIDAEAPSLAMVMCSAPQPEDNNNCRPPSRTSHSSVSRGLFHHDN